MLGSGVLVCNGWNGWKLDLSCSLSNFSSPEVDASSSRISKGFSNPSVLWLYLLYHVRFIRSKVSIKGSSFGKGVLPFFILFARTSVI